MVRLMPLPPVASCFDKIQIALTFLVPAYPNHLTKELVNWVSVVTQIIIVIMAALCNRGGGIIFLPCSFFLSIFLLSFFSSPNLSGHRLGVYHTLSHGVALVRI